MLFKHKKNYTSYIIITAISIVSFSFLYQLGFSFDLNGNANAEILQSISANEEVEMDFGRIYPGS